MIWINCEILPKILNIQLLHFIIIIYLLETIYCCQEIGQAKIKDLKMTSHKTVTLGTSQKKIWQGWMEAQGPHPHVLLSGEGVRGMFWNLKFWPKRIFLGHKKTQVFFWILYFLSSQTNNNVSAIYCWCGTFCSMLKT